MPAAVEEPLKDLRSKRKKPDHPASGEEDQRGGVAIGDFAKLRPIHPPPAPFVAGVVECVPTALPLNMTNEIAIDRHLTLKLVDVHQSNESVDLRSRPE